MVQKDQTKHHIIRGKRLFHCILAGIIVLSGCISVINITSLSRSPFEHTGKLVEPLFAVQNESGNTAVLDSAGSRVFLLSKEDLITGEIAYSGLSKTTPVSAGSLAADGEHLYILDHPNKTGFNSRSDRVLVYDFDGDYKKTLITSEALSNETHSFRIYTISAAYGKVYGVLYDELKPSVLVTAELTDGGMKPLHSFSTPDKVYLGSYNPFTDTTSAITHSGKLKLWKDEQLTELDLSNTDVHLAYAYPYADGSVIALDTNNNTISQYSENNSGYKVLAETRATSFSLKDDVLLYANQYDDSMHIKNIGTGNERIYNEIPFSSSILFHGYLTWIMVIIGSVALIILIISIIRDFRKKRASTNISISTNVSNSRPMTVSRLYGPMLVLLFFIYGITVLIIGNYHYETTIHDQESQVIDAAYSIKELSTLGLGDNLSKLRSQADFGSEAYHLVEGSINAVCKNHLNTTSDLTVSYRLFRIIENSDSVMIIQDTTRLNRIGGILSAEELKASQIFDAIKSAKEGNVISEHYVYNNGTHLFMVYSPILNTSGKVVGVLLQLSDESQTAASVHEGLTDISIKILTLLSGLLMLFAEIRYLLKVERLRKLRCQQSNKNITIVEADRTLQILARLPSKVFFIFCTLITAQILQNNGLSNPVLMALPLTVHSILSSLACAFTGPVVKCRPKAYMLIGIAASILSYVMMGAAVFLSSFFLMIGACVILGPASGIIYSATKTIQLSGLKPDPALSNMLFTKLETCIASAIGVAIGAVIRSFWGDKALITFVIGACVIHALVVLRYVGDDIAVEKTTTKNTKAVFDRIALFRALKTSKSFYLRPNVLYLLFAALVPIYCLDATSYYVMPLFNQYAGLSDVYIGLITTVVQLAAFIITPKVLSYTVSGQHSDSFWIAIMMASLALVFGLFGITTSMIAMVLVLIVITVVLTNLNAMRARMNIKEANQMGLNPNDTDAGFEIVSNSMLALNKIILGLMLIPGYKFFGWSWAAICGICFICGICVTIKTKKAEGTK